MRSAGWPALIVIAKAPVPGRAKTRLSPPCSPEQAARLAEASLLDTLAAVGRAPAARRILALDGRPGDWLPPGFEVVRQRGAGLGERLAAAFEAAGGPALLVGMDTPQLTSGLVLVGTRRLLAPGVDAVLGPAADGGYWAIGLREPDARVFDDVPMSTPQTGTAQRHRLRELGLATAELPRLRDVDIYADALAVAEEAPQTRFAREVRRLALAAAA
jgi:rSAM/selenodomain-associated transferase 1